MNSAFYNIIYINIMTLFSLFSSWLISLFLHSFIELNVILEETDCLRAIKTKRLASCGSPAVSSPSSPHGGAADPHSCVPLAHSAHRKKSSGAVTGKGGSFERFSLKSDAPCAGCGGISAGGDEWSWARNFSPVLPLLLLLLLEFPLGFASCDELDFTSSANMYSAALLLMLAIRIYADSMEGPTGKRSEKRNT